MSGHPGKRPLLHIGYHKTATSFLQASIFSNQTYFSQPWGVQASKAVEWFILNHAERFDADAARGDFLELTEGQNETVPVISHEALSGQPIGGRYYAERVAERIHRTFPDARILIGIREQKKLLSSLYYQNIRQGGTDTIEQFVRAPAGRFGQREKIWFDHFEYDLMLALYRRYWNPEDILVLPMELLQKDQSLYIRRLMDFAGFPEGAIEVKPSVNARRTNVTMRLERRFNQLVATPKPRPKKYKDYPLAYRMKNSALSLLEKFGPMQSMGRKEHARIGAHIEGVVGDHFAESNRRLASMTNLDLGEWGYF